MYELNELELASVVGGATASQAGNSNGNGDVTVTQTSTATASGKWSYASSYNISVVNSPIQIVKKSYGWW